MLATGARVGEVLAIRWADNDLGAQPPRLTINGTITRVQGEGLRRQVHPKTAAGHRTVLLPRFAVDTLMRLQLDAEPNPYDVIFPSSVGSLRDPHNLRRQWRAARGEMFALVTPHSSRKTVATLVDREHGGLPELRGRVAREHPQTCTTAGEGTTTWCARRDSNPQPSDP